MTMLRYRRYRVFVVFAVLTVLVLYQFAGTDTFKASGLGVKLAGDSPAEQADVLHPPPDDKQPDVLVPAADNKQPHVDPPALPKISKPEQKKPPPALPDASAPEQEKPSPALETTAAGNTDKDTPYVDDHAAVAVPDKQAVVPAEHGEGRKEVYVDPSSPAIHWQRQEEHFPVTSTIQMPTGTPKPVPKIQATFPGETTEEKREREAKLMTIKEAFTFTWQNYRTYAWMKDELTPVSNGSRNPFAGWGATLVDTLDTLWMMDLEAEFEEAVNAVADIDFTTSFRKDIPLFETVIRYLGGLVAAYDISGEKHRILLDKAVELAEILMGAFDTPNRMPVTFYYWMPTYASQPHQAGTRVVLAEIGSLSVEFTRLAQLTKEPKYYDAIARITNAFLEWEDTRLPGMWPVHVDASGCKRVSTSTSNSPAMAAHPAMKPASELVPSSKSEEKEELGRRPNPDRVGGENPVPSSKSEEKEELGRRPNPDRLGGKNPVPDDEHDELNDLSKRQLDDPISIAKAEVAAEKEAEVQSDKASSPKIAPPVSSPADCIPQGLAATSPHGSQTFTLGGMSDSMYEYLPKEYLLLGGLAPEYKAMYEKSMAAVKQKLLYRPMIPPGSPDMLFVGSLKTTDGDEYKAKKPKQTLTTEGAHLTCFAGGMFAYGAKIFGSKDDLNIGAELTQGCVWAYNTTKTGIMPESFLLTACDDIKGCEWDETKWHEALDPFAQGREETYQKQLEHYSSQVSVARAKATEPPTSPESGTADAIPTNGIPQPRKPIDRRQLRGESPAPQKAPSKTSWESAAEDNNPDRDDPIIGHIYKPQKPLGHAEYVKNRIEEERLPKGFTSVTSRHYILRPEAIESVWYMYRITGDKYWREAGWTMFEAIQQHCRAEFGYGAIDDVTKTAPFVKDEMESFWLAETLKYFYLLFSDENLVSLDEWVLNTEAHPFRRPDA